MEGNNPAMKAFLQGILSSALGFGLALGAGLVCLLVLAAALGSQGEKPIAKGSYLVIGNGLSITEAPDDGMRTLGSLLSGGQGETVDLYRALEAIDLAAKDEAIAGILVTDGLGAGLTARRELRDSLKAFRKASGKPVIAWTEGAKVGPYYLAAAADTVVLHPMGEISFAGLASYNTYLGKTLSDLGIGVQVTRVGKFKSAVEPFTQDRMSPEARAQSQSMMDEIWSRLVADVAEDRKVDAARLRRIGAEPGHHAAPDALRLGLVDKVLHRDELVALLLERGGKADKDGSFRHVGLARYAAKVRLPRGSGDTVAVVYAEGEIVDGMGGPGMIGGDRLAGTLRRLRADDDVKAVVLRIDSPGGSAFASELIHRELELLSRKGVVLVASMGDTAASGGYYIAAPAKVVLADPLTITGSIGVFGLHFNYGGLAGRFAVGTDGVKTAPFADLLDNHRPATEAEMAVVQASVDAIYETFLGVVSRGRKLTRDAVHEVAQGRVWTGSQARKAKLVDRFGGLRDAIALAAEEAGLKAGGYRLTETPALGEAKAGLAEMLFGDDEPAPVFAGAAKDPAMELLRGQWKAIEGLRRLNDRRGIYLLAPVGGVEAR